jgi:hypothetical protein
MNEHMTTAFFDELEQIQKEAGLLGSGAKFLSKGFKRLSQLGSKSGPMATVKGGPGHWERMKNIYRAGGLKGLAGSAYGQMGAAGALTGLGAYGTGKAVLGD